MSISEKATDTQLDVVLVGAGIMSATLAVILKELQPDLKIALFEKLDTPAQSVAVLGRSETASA